jgi:hypothetical protein
MAGPVETGLSVMIEQTITIGNIIEIVSIIGGGFTVFATLKNTVANIKVEVSGMQAEIKKLGDILIAQADMRGEMKVLETRLLFRRAGHQGASSRRWVREGDARD